MDIREKLIVNIVLDVLQELKYCTAFYFCIHAQIRTNIEEYTNSHANAHKHTNFRIIVALIESGIVT